MKPKLAITGVPVRSIPDIGIDGFYSDIYERYVPGDLQKTLELIKSRADELGLDIVHSEEIALPSTLVTIDDLLIAGRAMREKTRDADRIICFGPSHFGALAFYEHNETVARLDCHGDYFSEKGLGKNESFPGFGRASYMNAIEKRLKKVTVLNYGVIKMDSFGEKKNFYDPAYLKANHFDIDIDVFSDEFEMNDEYYKSFFKPEEAAAMLSKAKPQKIGVWEYKPEEDKHGNALKFLLSTLNVLVKEK